MVEDLRTQALSAIHYAQHELRWRPGKAIIHLAKRIYLGHLGPNTTLAEYEDIIRQILHDPGAKVYIFSFEGRNYPSLSIWLNTGEKSRLTPPVGGGSWMCWCSCP